MKDRIVDYHPINGYITFMDLINDIELIADDYKHLEEIVIDILKYNKYNDEIISSLFNSNIHNRLENIAYVLRNKL